MAPDDKEDWRRKREREEEQEAEEAKERAARSVRGKFQGAPTTGIVADLAAVKESGSTEKLLEILERVEPLMEQVHQLYNQFFAGTEKRPPLERRKQLDQAMEMVLMLPKPNPSVQFRCTTVRTRYQSFAEQWDRKLRQLEGSKRGR